jgi:inner membrane protein
VDNLCHTLAGAALARAGAGRGTAYGTAALLIGANLPDVDVLAVFLDDTTDLAVRRGWTHGVLALVVLPFLLAGSLVLWDRLRRKSRPRPPVVPRALLLASFLGVLSHPLLDLLNTYGVRLLMPFSDRWFYGDTLFIIDVWGWLLLSTGVYLSARRSRTGVAHPARPALVALAVFATYAAGMRALTLRAEAVARAAIEARWGEPVGSVLASPVPVDPLTRLIVATVPGGYRTGILRLGAAPAFTGRPDLVAAGPWRSEPVHAAMRTRAAHDFLVWARYPYVEMERVPAGTLVHFIDARYADRPGVRFGALSVLVPDDQPVLTWRPELPAR